MLVLHWPEDSAFIQWLQFIQATPGFERLVARNTDEELVASRGEGENSLSRTKSLKVQDIEELKERVREVIVSIILTMLRKKLKKI